MHPSLRNLLVATTALLALGLAPAAAGPEGGSVVGGAATIQGQGGPAVTVNQSSNSAIINWNTFNIGASESVRFNQPSSSSVALNRVTGGLGPSQIMGALTANGRIFLVNRDGILFGPGAVINTAGFLASTNDIRNADFMAGKYNFNIPGRPDASIVNKGTITATSGGFAALVAPGVRNSGTITATLGTVALASGNSFTLDMYGDKLITLAVGDQIASKVIDVASGRPLKSLVSNTRNGTLNANGGRVELTAAAARAVVDSVINTRGVIRADSIGHRNGMIVLAAATGASKPAGAPAQTIKISGTLSAAGKDRGTRGGTIVVSGEHIKLKQANLDASGRRGGGKVMIGGDWGGGNPNKSLVKNNQSATLEDYAIGTATTVNIDGRTTINASATRRGDGGKVVIWSDTQTTFAGTILARGGTQGGDGGFVETSSHGQLAFTGNVNAGAPRGRAGTLLLDPQDIVIDSRTADAIGTSLANNDVTLTTDPTVEGNGNIELSGGAHVAWNAGTTLTLNAYNNIIFESGSRVTNTGSGSLVLRADNTGTGEGTVVFSPGSRVDFGSSTGAISIFYNPSGEGNKYENPTPFLCSGPCPGGGVLAQTSQLTAYMLVNTAADLQAVTTSTIRPNAYALGRNINASSIANFTPIGNAASSFNTIFDGQGFTISNLAIAPLDSTTRNIGLFGSIGTTGIVRNLNLTDVRVSANPNVPSQSVGTLAGTNAGQIINVSVSQPNSQVSGFVNGLGIVGVGAGGLVGQNAGVIADSGSAATISVGDSSSTTASNIAGGLVATNLGTITGSSTSGDVTGGAFSLVGGLVGQNAGKIANSFASGNVTVGAAGVAGGFAGTGNGAFVANNATGAVSGGGNSVLGGFIGVFSFAGGPAIIQQSTASGPVTGTGATNTVGGFAGLTSGTITASSASGPVSGISDSYLGGFAGVNLGAIQASSTATSSTVTGTGDRNIIGGFVGANFGSIDSSTSAGNASGNTNSAVGGFAGTNATFINFSAGSVPNSSFPVGSITNSFATGTATGGSGSTVSTFVALSNPTSASNLPPFPSILGGCSDPTCVFVDTGQLPPPGSQPQPSPEPFPQPSPSPLLPVSPDFFASLPVQSQIISNLVQNTQLVAPSPDFFASLPVQSLIISNLVQNAQLVALNTTGNPPLVNNIQGGINLPAQPPVPTPTPGTAAGRQILPGIDRRIVNIPPPGETRMIQDEVVVQIATSIGPDRLQAAVRSLGLTVIESQTLTSTGSTVVRLRIPNGRTPAAAIRSLANVGMAAIVQPNYVYSLQQPGADQSPAPRGDIGQQGDPAQYILEKLKISDVHRVVRGTNVLIAVIDSEIDAAHPDLEGVIAKRFSAVGGAQEKPHAHGTGMAGAIGSHQRLIGTAPAARILAVHAFSINTANTESTTFNILKGIDWSVNQGVRIINMSFAGPKDPSVERALKLAYDRGIVLIAAAGNAGPKSPPLFPGAVPYVIAVTATDVDDKLFAGANRGKYISVAAPGVDILVPAPEGSYQVTTGTSVAAAEVSGIVALLLERNPKLTPADIRRILTSSAKRLGPGDHDDNFGSGLVDPLKALQLAIPRTATTTPNPAQQ
jgi:filamentous hemagglutinin family protein